MKKFIAVILVISFIHYFAINAAAVTSSAVGDNNGTSVVTVQSTRTAGDFKASNQGYRITLLDKSDNYKPLYIIDLISHRADDPMIYNCSGYYGFNDRCYLDTSNPVLFDIFESGRTETESKYGMEGHNYLNGYKSQLTSAMNTLVGQCKLFYIANVDKRYIGNCNQYIDNLNSWNTDDNYRLPLSCKSVITAEEYNLSDYGFTVPILDSSSTTENNDFYFIICNNTNGSQKYASFYNKSAAIDSRFIISLYSCFQDKMGSAFDYGKLNEYTLMFEPIVWFYECKTEGNYIGSVFAGSDYGTSEDELPLYAFYGTITELAFIQSNSADDYNRVVGFVGKDFVNNPTVTYDAGLWLEDMQVLAFTDGGAMMVSSETQINDITIKPISEFVSAYPEAERAAGIDFSYGDMYFRKYNND